MSNASSIQILYGRRTSIGTETQRIDPATWDAAGVEVAIVGEGGSPEQQIGRSQDAASAYRAGLFAGAQHGCSVDRNRGFVFEFPKIDG